MRADRLGSADGWPGVDEVVAAVERRLGRT
jgi:hypothetical protein